jgi:hypothetical protein
MGVSFEIGWNQNNIGVNFLSLPNQVAGIDTKFFGFHGGADDHPSFAAVLNNS